MKTESLASTSSSKTTYGSCDTASTSSPMQDAAARMPKKEDAPEDKWLGVTTRPSRKIPGTNYFLSRVGKAVVTENLDQPRYNKHGYDKDNPKMAIAHYEETHPEPKYKRAFHAVTDAIFNAVTCCVPFGLSASAGKHKQRIDQNVVLGIVRESVDRFPELKIRIAPEKFAKLDQHDQMKWQKKMSIIRAAQHDFIVNELDKAYPGHINKNAETLLYTGGRATGYLRVLYCSMDEYVALYWSDWGLKSTDSGSYHAHVYDYVTEGENQNWSAHDLSFNPSNFETTPPGEYTFLGAGDRKIWSFDGPCGMVDHGIGDIPSMAKFAMLSNVTSTLNFSAIGHLLSSQVSAVAHEYGQRFKESLGCTHVSSEPVSRVSEEELKKAVAYFAPIMERVRS